jgi:hypothetical protein
LIFRQLSPVLGIPVLWFDDFLAQGNLERILASISIAKARGATLRVGPELEIPSVETIALAGAIIINGLMQGIWMP